MGAGFLSCFSVVPQIICGALVDQCRFWHLARVRLWGCMSAVAFPAAVAEDLPV